MLDILASVDITVSAVSSTLKAQTPLQMGLGVGLKPKI